MTPSEKYIEEKDELKNVRKNRILKSAFFLFSEKGIDTIAMTDIAKKAEIGVASLYRYYETKEEIAIRTSIWIWEKEKEVISKLLFSNNYETLSGIDQLEKICRMFITLLETEESFLRYIYFFDSFAVRTNISKEKLNDYEKTIESVNNIVFEAIKKGISDNSIDKKFNGKEQQLYFSILHSLFCMSQKLSLNQNLLKMDSKESGKDELELIITLLINSLKNKE